MLTLAVHADEVDGYLLMVYDDATVCKVPMGRILDKEEGKQELYFNEIAAYEQKLDFLTARDKCAAYVERYPTDEDGVKSWRS